MSREELKISVIIPFLNELENLKLLLPYLQSIVHPGCTEIIFVDGGSKDGSYQYLESENANVFLSPEKGRAYQMNYGAKKAHGVIYYFLHADTTPNPEMEKILLEAYLRKIPAACFSYSFDSSMPLLKINSWFTRFNSLFSGGGDQSLYIQKEVFDSLKGFNEDFCIMEDFELNRRLRKKYKFHIFNADIRVSARKYEKNGWLKVQYANFLAFFYFISNRPPEKIKTLYHTILDL